MAMFERDGIPLEAPMRNKAKLEKLGWSLKASKSKSVKKSKTVEVSEDKPSKQ